MELKRHQSDLTDTSKRALATNRGKSETLKSTYETLESEYKAKRSNLNAEQARFVRLMKSKLPAIKVSKDDSAESANRPRFLTPPNSPLVERQKTTLPALVGPSHTVVVRRRSKSFSDLPHALGVHEQEMPGSILRQKSCEQLGKDQENFTEKRTNFNSARPRSLSAIDCPPSPSFRTKSRSDDEGERLFEDGRSKHSLPFCSEAARKQSSPARLFPIDVDRIHETRKTTSKKSFGKQLEDVKDLRYLRTGRYTTSQALETESNLINQHE